MDALIRKKLALVIIRRAVYLKIMKRAFLFTHRILHSKKFSEYFNLSNFIKRFGFLI